MRRTGTTISIAIFALTSTSMDRAAQADDISGDSGVFTGQTVLAEATRDTEHATAARTVGANSQTDDPKTAGSGGQQTSPETEKSLGDFDNVSTETLQSIGWTESTDTDFGGNSQASLSIVEGSNGLALQISGDTKRGYAYPWAGAMYFLDSETKQAVDASKYSKITFAVKGAGQKYRVYVFATSLGYRPAIVSLKASAEWDRVEIPFKSFRGFDPSGLIAVLFSGPANHGEFSFQVDEIAIRE